MEVRGQFFKSVFSLWILGMELKLYGTWQMPLACQISGQPLSVHANTFPLTGAVTTSHIDGISEIQVCDCLLSQFGLNIKVSLIPSQPAS